MEGEAFASHPFVERLIGTIRREYLAQTLFWTAVDLEEKLQAFQRSFNRHPISQAGKRSAANALAKGHENQSCVCQTGDDRERRDRTSSGEVEADKLAGPAHASLSE